MSAPFAALEARVNADVIKHLANAVADFGYGVTADVIFDNNFVSTFGIDSASPAFHCQSADVVDVMRGTSVIINSVNYKAVRKEPDGTGWTTVILELAA